MGVVFLHFVDYIVEVYMIIFTIGCLILYRVRAQRSRWE
jgi:hypothetical protein